jgi:hypothetical protein
MDKKYLQRRSHRFTQGRIPISLIYIKNIAVKDNKMPVGIDLYFLAIQHIVLLKKCCFGFRNTAKNVYYVHMKADSNNLSFTFHVTVIQQTFYTVQPPSLALSLTCQTYMFQ